MELKFALLADVVSHTTEGKLNIVGEFDVIWTQKPPVVWPLCYLVARFQAPVTAGTDHTFQFAVNHLNGSQVIPRSPEVPLKMVPQRPRYPLRGNAIIRLSPLELKELGTYEFKLWVDREYMGSVNLFVLKAHEPQGA